MPQNRGAHFPPESPNKKTPVGYGKHHKKCFSQPTQLQSADIWICEVSSWAVMEVIVWNKVLDAEKMAKASDYLMAKLAAGVQEENSE